MNADDAHRAEAMRLAALPADVRQQLLDAFRVGADDAELTPDEQDQARGRVLALEQLLREGGSSVTFGVRTNWTRNTGFTLAFCLSPCVSFGVYFQGNTFQRGRVMLAVYVRVSSVGQDTRSQKPELRAWAAARESAGESVQWFRDKFTGTTMDGRHGRSYGRVSCRGG